MQRSIRLSLSLTVAAALSLGSTPIQPVAAQEDGSAADLGVMEINLKDAVQFNWGFQGALQGAGTPNQAGIGAFLPIAVGENSVWFIDALANTSIQPVAAQDDGSADDLGVMEINLKDAVRFNWGF